MLQIWSEADVLNTELKYTFYKPSLDDRYNKWLHVASKTNDKVGIKVKSNLDICLTEIDKEIKYNLNASKMLYILNLEGNTAYNDVTIEKGDTIEVVNESITIVPENKSHIIVFEVYKI